MTSMQLDAPGGIVDLDVSADTSFTGSESLTAYSPDSKASESLLTTCSPGSQASESRQSACSPFAESGEDARVADPLRQILALRQRVCGLTAELEGLPVALDIISAWRSSSSHLEGVAATTLNA